MSVSFVAARARSGAPKKAVAVVCRRRMMPRGYSSGLVPDSVLSSFCSDAVQRVPNIPSEEIPKKSTRPSLPADISPTVNSKRRHPKLFFVPSTLPWPRGNAEQQQQRAFLRSPVGFQRQCFGTTNRSNGVNGDHNKEEPEPSRGQASISFATSGDNEWEQNETETNRNELSEADRSKYTVPIVVEMPRLDADETTTYALEAWHVAPGSLVVRNDVLCDVGTPDFVFGMQLDDAEEGLLVELHVAEGDRVPGGTPICTIHHPSATGGGGGGDDDEEE